MQRKSLGPFMKSSLCLPRAGLSSLPLRALLSHAVGVVKLIPAFKYFRHLVYLLTYTCWNLSSPSFTHSLPDKSKVGDDIFLNFYSWREAWLSGREIFQRTALLWEPSAPLCVSSGPASAARTAPVSGQRQISQTLLHALIYIADWKISFVRFGSPFILAWQDLWLVMDCAAQILLSFIIFIRFSSPKTY